MTAINLLIVEDSADDAELMVRVLRQAGVAPTYERVETPETMDAALARGSWDLVISDYAMPRFSGLAALKLLQDKELDLPFIMVSGSAGENVAVDAMKAGAHHYILKDNLARLAPAVERELREAESRRERKRAESRYRNLFNTVPVGVFMNTPEGKVIEANPWFVAMLGFDDQESLKRINVSELWKRPGERAKLYALLARDGVVENFEAEFRRPDGACLWCVVSAHVVYNADGKIDHYEGVSVDITERKRAEQELSRARDAALEGVRIKSEFMSNMSHEIRTPLNGIMGMNELLLTSGLNPEQFQCAKTAVECGGLLTAIVNDILDFSKLVEGKMIFEQIDFDLSEVFENTIESFAEKAHSKDLELIPAVAGGVPAIVSGDPTRLRQVLNNLIGNALKFTDHGEVAVSITVQARTREKVTLRFAVRDTGIGIPQALQGALFSPFSQADASTTRKYGGTGLGLTISAKLAEGMKGKIDFESVSGEGSTFCLTAVFGIPAAFTPEPPEISPLAGRSALIVDDNASNCAALAGAMRSWGMSVHALGSGAEALAAMRRRSVDTPLFEVILVDAQMPGMDGLTLARTIRCDPRLAKTPLIMMGTTKKYSATSTSRGRDFAFHEFDDSGPWLSKPIRPSHLLATLCGLLDLKPSVPQTLDHEAKPPAPSAAVAPSEGNSRDPIRILVVDDNLVNRIVAQKQLERLGYQVDIVDGGRSALAAMASVSYSILLLDCEMPEMDGYAVAAETRRRESGQRRTTIIAMTSHALTGARERCLASGMDEYVAKPVTIDALAAVLEAAPGRPGTASFSPDSTHAIRNSADSPKIEGSL
jgi:two-component system sensor histidine kinase/response regulator